MYRKKMWLVIAVAILSKLTLFAEEQVFTSFSNWEKSPGAEVTFNEKGETTVTGPGYLLSPKSVPVKQDDCFLVTVLSELQGKVEYGMIGYDAQGRITEHIIRSTSNASDGKLDQRSFTAEIRNTNTVSIRFLAGAAKESRIFIHRLEAEKLSPKDNAFYSQRLNRKLWAKRIQGNNLVAGRALTFEPSPNYPLTAKGGTDATDLTDGKLASREDDQIWFSPEAVGFSNGKNPDQKLIADLGSVKPVQKAVLRVCCGRIGKRENRNAPNLLETWVSKDGNNYYLASRLKRVAETERADVDWKTLYWLPERLGSTCFVYPFELDINADARYVLIHNAQNSTFTLDEIAIIEGDPNTPDFNQVYSRAPEPVMHQTVIVKPRMEKFYIASGIYLPNWLTHDDRRTKKTGAFSFTIDLPEEVSYEGDNVSYGAFTRTLVRSEKKDGRQLLTFHPDCKYDQYLRNVKGLTGPFYFRAEKPVPAAQSYAIFTTLIDGKPQYTAKLPIEILNIQSVPELKKFSISWWNLERFGANWPGHFDAMRSIGFNTIPFFPLNSDIKEYPDFIRNARALSFKVRAMICPTFAMIKAALKAGERKTLKCQVSPEFECPLPVWQRGAICPSYRGKYYEDICKQITAALKENPCDYISVDEESWSNGINVFLHCPRCDALRKSLGLEWKPFLSRVQADYIGGFLSAAKKACPNIVTGVYWAGIANTRMSSLGLIHFNGFLDLYPKYCSESQPSLYSSNTKMAHMQTREAFQFVKNPRQLNCWRSAGTGAYRTDQFGTITEWQLLETIMNGASGVQYFKFDSFESPLDFYYVAAALRLLAPFEHLLMKAELDEKFTGSDPNLLYTRRFLDAEALILVGNYEGMKPRETMLDLPGAKTVKDLVSGKEIKLENGKLKLIVDGNNMRFLQIKKTERKREKDAPNQ